MYQVQRADDLNVEWHTENLGEAKRYADNCAKQFQERYNVVKIETVYTTHTIDNVLPAEEERQA